MAGRTLEKVGTVAELLGLVCRAFDLADTSRLEAAIKDAAVVLCVAGPFSATSRPIADACIRNRIHYLDITGELDVFEALAARDAEAKAAGVVLLPGAGFDVVPSDCLAAHLKQGLGIRYEMASGKHPLIGKPVPDIPGIEEAMRLPRPVLFDLSGSIDLRAAVDSWTDRVDVLALTASTDLGALLVRADGYVVWALDREFEAGDLLELRDTLTRWFGEPRDRNARQLPAIRRALNDLHGERAG